MITSEKVYFAIERSSILHNGQYRKDEKTPFIAHPFSVGFLLAKYTDDEDIIIAGFLHDVLEDVDSYSREDMKREFGERITNLVLGVTHDNNLGWKERTDKYLEKLQENKDFIMISCADKVHNINSSIEGFEEMGEGFWNSFYAEKEDYHWFYNSVLAIAKEKLDNPIVLELEDIIKKSENTVFRGCK